MSDFGFKSRITQFLLYSTLLFFMLGDYSAIAADTAELSWQPNTENDLAGYNVYHGSAPGRYGFPTNVGYTTTFTLTDLDDGTHYFTVTAYDFSGNESGPSNEVSKTITDPLLSTHSGDHTVVKGFIGNFNGDNRADLIWHHTKTGNVTAWVMDEKTMVSNIHVASVSDLSWMIQDVGDFNGDGNSDLIWRHGPSGTVFGWLMNGLSITTSGSLGNVSQVWQLQGHGDFNGDGNSDLIWRHSTSGDVVIWLMDGLTVMLAEPVRVVASAWAIQDVGDFNGDGNSDLIWRHSTSGEVVIWLMDGPTVMSADPVGAVASAWAIQNVGDFNGDGNPDLTWRHSTSGEVVIWLMEGTTFISADLASIAK